MNRGTHAIEIRNLRASLGGQEILKGVNLRIPSGSLVALIGPNGSGKTTLLRCILGLQAVDSGEIQILGKPLGREALDRVGYVPQRLALDPSFVLSVREFLALRRRETRHWFWTSHRKLDDQLKTFTSDLAVPDLLDRPLAGLSGGQLQRVLIAASLMKNPELILLDEPTAGVDTPGEQSFYELIGTIQRERKLTVVLVSHDLSMVYRQATRVYALNGVICCEGSPEEVMNADSLKQAYGIHFSPYHHHHQHPHHFHIHPHVDLSRPLGGIGPSSRSGGKDA